MFTLNIYDFHRLIAVAVEISLSLLTRSSGRITDLSILRKLLEFTHLLWKDADARERQRQIEEESIYKYKPITCTITDEEEKETGQGIDSFFSNYDLYFSTENSMESKPDPESQMESTGIKRSDSTSATQMTDAQMRLIKDLHEVLCSREMTPQQLLSPSTPSLSSLSLPSNNVMRLAGELWRGQDCAEGADSCFIIGLARGTYSLLKTISSSEVRDK